LIKANEDNRMKTLPAAFLLLGLVALPTYGHHSFPGMYDVSQQSVLAGVATRFLFRNPHTFIFLEVTNDDGVAEEWHLEMAPLWALVRSGMTKDSIQPGDELLVTCNPARDGGRSCGLGQRGGFYRAADDLLVGLDPRTVGQPPSE
jgi:hypothetical protein